jgi:hypothetical protein
MNQDILDFQTAVNNPVKLEGMAGEKKKGSSIMTNQLETRLSKTEN